MIDIYDVFDPTNEPETPRFECHVCKGTGRILVPSEDEECGIEYDICPECDGIGEVEAEYPDIMAAYHIKNDC